MYRVGRSFEYRVIYKLKKFGINAKRVPLSGRLNPLLPRCDIIIKLNDKELKGQLKYSRKKYVVFKKYEVEQLKNKEIDFLCFGFYRKEPKFIVLVNSLENFKEKNSENLVIKKEDKNIKYKDIFLRVLNFEEFINYLKLNYGNKS
jgi:Holliday junction resolvase